MCRDMADTARRFGRIAWQELRAVERLIAYEHMLLHVTKVAHALEGHSAVNPEAPRIKMVELTVVE